MVENNIYDDLSDRSSLNDLPIPHHQRIETDKNDQLGVHRSSNKDGGLMKPEKYRVVETVYSIPDEDSSFKKQKKAPVTRYLDFDFTNDMSLAQRKEFLKK